MKFNLGMWCDWSLHQGEKDVLKTVCYLDFFQSTEKERTCFLHPIVGDFFDFFFFSVSFG